MVGKHKGWNTGCLLFVTVINRNNKWYLAKHASVGVDDSILQNYIASQRFSPSLRNNGFNFHGRLDISSHATS